MPKAHGRATSIRKRGCHLSIVIAEIKESGKAEKKVVKTADPIKLEKLVAESEKSAKGVKKVATEKGAEVIDPRMEGRASKKESSKGHAAKMFSRKTG